jgi:transcriptional regulator with XRE-family HTH domain
MTRKPTQKRNGKMAKTRKSRAVNLGAEIRRLRKKSGLNLEDLAKQTGLTEDYLARIEEETEIPPVGAMLQISRVLSLDAGKLLSQGETADRKRKKKESYQKRKRSYAYKTLAPGGTTMHLKAFLVTIDAHQDHDMVDYRHDGEEFVYVLEGKVNVTVGENEYKLAKGRSLHFNSAIPHMLRNPGNVRTELIVVLYTP